MTLVRIEEEIQDKCPFWQLLPGAPVITAMNGRACIIRKTQRMECMYRRGFDKLIQLEGEWNIPSKFDMKDLFWEKTDLTSPKSPASAIPNPCRRCD